MKFSTIREAIVDVLSKNKDGLTSKQIFAEIQNKGLFDFKAKNPLSVLNSTIRKSCEGIELKKSSKDKIFKVTPKGIYTLMK